MPGICTNRCDTTTLEPHKRPRFVPGEPAESELYLRTASEFAEDRIPPYNAGIDLRYPCRLSPEKTTATLALKPRLAPLADTAHGWLSVRTGPYPGSSNP